MQDPRGCVLVLEATKPRWLLTSWPQAPGSAVQGAVLGLSRSLLAGLSRSLLQDPCTACSNSVLLGLFQLSLCAGWDGAGTSRRR